jgi:2-oxoglutarate dehydrogenase E1 component
MGADFLELAGSLPFIDELYARYLQDPNSVDESWRRVFANGFAARAGNGAAATVATAVVPARAIPLAAPPLGAADLGVGRIHGLVNAYRVRGHLEAELDPLEHLPRGHHPDLDYRTYGFTEADLDRVMPSGGLYGISEAPLREIIRRLRATYCGSIGLEMMHITSTERRAWLQQRIEPSLNVPSLDSDSRIYVLDRITAAEQFESFVHTKYVGTKRFSLEGAESLIPLLELTLERAGLGGVEEVVIGMAHRGRLNVLANIMGKSPGDIFAEFEDIDPESMFGGGDVKYHLGFSSDRTTRTGDQLHLSLAFNPSHLEAVDPIVVGRVRAKQRRRRDKTHERVLGILIHGDAAFAGQGLVAETLNLSDLHGYRSGGTVHVIVNNQIGFTTLPQASRSTTYCTDVAKMIQVPIFHVNGEDPDAVAQVVRVAMEYRRTFHCDVIIDMFCYRKYGHNEADEPAFTQPRIYEKIERRKTVRQIYGERLVQEGVIGADEPQKIVARQHQFLEAEFSRKRARPMVPALGGSWAGFLGGPDVAVPEAETGVAKETMALITERVTTLPEGFSAHPKIQRLLAGRRQMGLGQQPLDWAMGEALALGSICLDGHLVRISGQDSRRGTFSQRHAVIVDQKTEAEYVPLAHLREEQAFFRIYDSPLSEAAVLGFEFGYSLDYPDGLVMWEAQFGDFVNGAQVIIDQFINSSEDKWKRLSGLVMLLPHGFEGQGPEHSSARFERFLEASAEDNIQVCYPTTPAQYFHLLRRQVVRKWRKPLIVMTPKSLLRLPAARSQVAELTTGRFRRVLDDPTPPAEARRVLLCTGKVFYDLDEERKRRKDTQTAILRIEQLYPLSDARLARALDVYAQAEELVWVQEEPANMGAHRYIFVRLLQLAAHRAVRAVTRAESASPATGSSKAHALEQADLVGRAFAPIDQL